MPFKYNKVLVIGATSGIGYALATKFTQEGSKVIVVGRRKEKLDQLVSEVGSDKAEAIQFDITQLDKISKFAEDVTKSHPDIDSVFLNSGIQRAFDFSKPDTVDLSILDEEVKTNYTSYLHLTLAFIPFLQKKQNETSLIYTTSGLGLVPMMRAPNYCATKAALHVSVTVLIIEMIKLTELQHWILVLRQQLKEGPGNINVIEIFPPAVQTELHDTKHQPDLKDGHKIGMPLKDFTDETFAGLAAGKDQIAVGMSAGNFNTWEQERQKNFFQMKEAMSKMLGQHEKKPGE